MEISCSRFISDSRGQGKVYTPTLASALQFNRIDSSSYHILSTRHLESSKQMCQSYYLSPPAPQRDCASGNSSLRILVLIPKNNVAACIITLHISLPLPSWWVLNLSFHTNQSTLSTSYMEQSIAMLTWQIPYIASATTGRGKFMQVQQVPGAPCFCRLFCGCFVSHAVGYFDNPYTLPQSKSNSLVAILEFSAKN